MMSSGQSYTRSCAGEEEEEEDGTALGQGTSTRASALEYATSDRPYHRFVRSYSGNERIAQWENCLASSDFSPSEENGTASHRGM